MCWIRSITRSSSPIPRKRTRSNRGRSAMEGFVATKLAEFDQGKISRRRLIETLTLAATTVYATEGAKAQSSGPGLKDTEVTLPFGKMGEQPYNVTAKDVPLTFIIARTRDPNSPPNPRTAGRPRPDAVIDHVAYTVADFNREKAKAELIAMGVKNVRDGGLYSLHLDDPFGYDVQISGFENNALTDG